ncbi:MAG: hypothetical protein N3G80_00125 [Candidatus Micrarchaeota archaeon]|nr:hypothetical protein [Candidatus Micrarchaeota archaeon]
MLKATRNELSKDHKQLALAAVLHRDAIAKFIEKIAPKVSRLRPKFLPVDKIVYCRLGNKKVIKFIYS